MITKDKYSFSACLPCIFVSKSEMDQGVFNGVTFHKENGNEILVWKAEKGLKDCQSWTSFGNTECFILLAKQLTMNAIRISTTKYSKPSYYRDE